MGGSCFQLDKYHHLQTLATKGALVLPPTSPKLLASLWQEQKGQGLGQGQGQGQGESSS